MYIDTFYSCLHLRRKCFLEGLGMCCVVFHGESVAGRGLTPDDLRKIFERSGKTGLLCILKTLVKRPVPLSNAPTDNFQP